jgi:hypothetical protein
VLIVAMRITQLHAIGLTELPLHNDDPFDCPGGHGAPVPHDRTLHRRLVDEGTPYRELLEGVRHTLAVEHVSLPAWLHGSRQFSTRVQALGRGCSVRVSCAAERDAPAARKLGRARGQQVAVVAMHVVSSIRLRRGGSAGAAWIVLKSASWNVRRTGLAHSGS